MVTLDSAAVDLRRPFAPELVLWRPVRPDVGPIGAVGQVAPYINKELVVDRLNVVCPGLWSTRYELARGEDGPLMWCHLTIDQVTRSDIGEGKGKTLVTDAIKRAALHFGVGVSLGAMPRIDFTVGDTDRFRLKRVGTGEHDVLITDAGRAACERIYRDWLTQVGHTAYGPALSHAAPDQRRSIRGDSNAEVADAHAAGPAIDPVLVRESLIHRIGELSGRAGIEVPVIAWENDAELKVILERLEQQAAEVKAAA